MEKRDGRTVCLGPANYALVPLRWLGPGTGGYAAWHLRCTITSGYVGAQMRARVFPQLDRGARSRGTRGSPSSPMCHSFDIACSERCRSRTTRKGEWERRSANIRFAMIAKRAVCRFNVCRLDVVANYFGLCRRALSIFVSSTWDPG